MAFCYSNICYCASFNGKSPIITERSLFQEKAFKKSKNPFQVFEIAGEIARFEFKEKQYTMTYGKKNTHNLGQK